MSLDLSTLRPEVRDRLHDEDVVWLTTVNAAGEPTPTPVWFLVVDNEVWMRSKPGGAKLAHLQSNSSASANLNTNELGNDVVVLNGVATIESVMPTAVWDGYVAKYAEKMIGLRLRPDEFEATYSVALRFTPQRVRSW